jgi:cation/acetate symporter
MALSVLWHFGFSPEAMFAGAAKIKTRLALKTADRRAGRLANQSIVRTGAIS